MKYLTNTLLLFFLITTSAKSFASGAVGAVSRLFPNGTSVSFRIVGDTCNTGNDYYFFTMDDTSGGDNLEIKRAWVSMLIASLNTGKPIVVKVDNCEPGSKAIQYIYQDMTF